MENQLLIITAAFILGFISSFIFLKYSLLRGRKETFFPLYLPMCLSLLVLFFLFPSSSDFLHELYWAEIISVIICSLLIFTLCRIPRLSRYDFLFLIIGAEICYYFIAPDQNLISPSLPIWADSILSILGWSLFAYSFRWLGTLNGLQSRQSLTLFGGIALLYFLGCAPWLISLISISFCGISLAWLLFESYPAHLRLSPAGSSAIGFIFGWLIFLCGMEGSGACITCFIMFFIYEIFISTVKKFSLRPEHRNFSHNSDYMQANLNGLSPQDICSAISKLMLLLVIFGCFEAFAPNRYSVPLLALISTAWFGYRLNHWRNFELQPSGSFDKASQAPNQKEPS